MNDHKLRTSQNWKKYANLEKNRYLKYQQQVSSNGKESPTVSRIQHTDVDGSDAAPWQISNRVGVMSTTQATLGTDVHWLTNLLFTREHMFLLSVIDVICILWIHFLYFEWMKPTLSSSDTPPECWVGIFTCVQQSLQTPSLTSGI